MKKIAIMVVIALAVLSQNRVEISKDSTSPDFSTKLSVNAASHSQLAALEAEGF
jgi:DNA uptake protein ComE-like DNA-binding protein